MFFACWWHIASFTPCPLTVALEALTEVAWAHADWALSTHPWGHVSSQRVCLRGRTPGLQNAFCLIPLELQLLVAHASFLREATSAGIRVHVSVLVGPPPTELPGSWL